MRHTRVRRSGIVGAMVAALLGVLVVLVPSSAVAEEDARWECHGAAVLRCAAVWQDADGHYYARAKIVDAEGGGDYTVWVVDVKLITGSFEDPITMRSNSDRDGGFDVQDLARTSAVDQCSFNPLRSFRVQATFYWRGPVNDSETWSPNMGWVDACLD